MANLTERAFVFRFCFRATIPIYLNKDFEHPDLELQVNHGLNF